MERQFGLLMPIFSVESQYGVGDFGENAYKFVDFAKKSGAKLWQVLPLVQTGYGNSPYSSVCSYSLNPYYISLDDLVARKLLTKSEILNAKLQSNRVDYDWLYNTRFNLLRKAFNRFDVGNIDFVSFSKNRSTNDYALFMAIKSERGNRPFYEWENELKYRDSKALQKFSKEHKDTINFYKFIQFIATEQWLSLKAYANKNGIKIMGDMPLYVALDSVDVWTNPQVFKLDQNLMPKKVAGVPPDYFSSEGQLWGNPVYDYEYLSATNFKWWVARLKKITTLFDFVRVDHFRGLDRYYEIPVDANTARHGEWVDVPSKELFDKIFSKINRKKIIAEDLGIIDDGVRELLEFTGCPGMKILSFAFNGDKQNFYLPERIENNYVCYTGTHDNNTLCGLIDNSSAWDLNNLYNGVNESIKANKIKGLAKDKDSLADLIIELGFSCKADAFILPIQDVLGLSSEYRINIPGRVSENNWSVIIPNKLLTTKKAKQLSKLCIKYNR